MHRAASFVEQALVCTYQVSEFDSQRAQRARTLFQNWPTIAPVFPLRVFYAALSIFDVALVCLDCGKPNIAKHLSKSHKNPNGKQNGYKPFEISLTFHTQKTTNTRALAPTSFRQLKRAAYGNVGHNDRLIARVLFHAHSTDRSSTPTPAHVSLNGRRAARIAAWYILPANLSSLSENSDRTQPHGARQPSGSDPSCDRHAAPAPCAKCIDVCARCSAQVSAADILIRQCDTLARP